MNQLPYLATLATRHAWAEREYARLHADLVEATLIARVRSAERAAQRRAWVRDRFSELRPVRRRQPVPYCARAAAHTARTAGGVR
ncbi:hypothetical protein E1293_44245 [Actinomadura darangshiensis]|uniref:Uncharacterized protein n=1 Tax=Actinomadura darangshiensis TaxID=705336 RepID=A0A4R4ZYI7_9ACTN|nr:hypothetical protein [Actinomadura darangshiensis]TDD62262.1 hypothetical protein E1293_44245 [Actinomadura darangshiensis]